MTAWIQVGVVGKAHGLRGHFYISQRSIPLPEKCEALRVGSDPDRPEISLSIVEKNWNQQRQLVRCKELGDRTAVEVLQGKALWMARTDAGSETVWADFIGKPLIDADGLLVGEVIDVNNFGANDSIVVMDRERNANLHIPLVSTYVDLSFKPSDAHVKLLVSKTLFDEFWNV